MPAKALHSSELRNLKITADLTGEKFVDLSMSRNSRSLSGAAVHIDRMVLAFAKQTTTVLLEVA
jgi:hypothetical protein